MQLDGKKLDDMTQAELKVKASDLRNKMTAVGKDDPHHQDFFNEWQLVRDKLNAGVGNKK